MYGPEKCKRCGTPLNISQGGFTTRDPMEIIDPICPNPDCRHDSQQSEVSRLGQVITVLIIVAALIAWIVFSD